MFRRLFIIILFLVGHYAYGQIDKHEIGKIEVNRLMDSLWTHPSSFVNHNDPNWIRLNQHLQNVDVLQLNELIHSIFYGRSSFILNKSHAEMGFVGVLNKSATDKKLKKFHKKIRAGFRDSELYPNNKLVLVEGDSWFEYPVFLREITDFLEKKPDLAIYSLASGSDWVSNMISNLHYEYTYAKIKPDVFIISGGGNDVVGDYRLSAFINDKPIKEDNPFLINFSEYCILRMKKKTVSMSHYNDEQHYNELSDSLFKYRQEIDTVLLDQLVTGRRFLNKNFYRWMATLKIEYKMLFESLRKIDPERFDSILIITQGYDYPTPSYKRKFGAHMFMKNGEWLKEPLMVRGINDPYIQKSIIATIIFEVNEMMIELGEEYNNIYHVDSRGLTSYYERLKGKKPGTYWYDELHPTSKIFKIIADVYTDVIRNKFPDNQKVIVVKDVVEERLKD